MGRDPDRARLAGERHGGEPRRDDSQEAGYAAALWLSTATVGSDLLLHRATITSENGPAVMADFLTASGDVLGDSEEEGRFAATGADPRGAICLDGATITGRLSLGGAQLVNDRGPALSAELATCKHGVYLDWGFAATGAVRLRGVQHHRAAVGARREDLQFGRSVAPGSRKRGGAVAGQRDGRDASRSSRSAPEKPQRAGLDGRRCHRQRRRAAGRKRCGRFFAKGRNELGAVYLARANIAGDLTMTGADVSNIQPTTGKAGCAVDARDAKIGCEAVLDRGLVANAPDGCWIVSLAGATVGKRLSCRLQLTGRASPTPKPKSLDLSDASAGELVLDVGTSPLDPRTNPTVDTNDLIHLDGLTYTTTPRLVSNGDAAVADTSVNPQTELGQWINVLSWASFAPQPYQQLASAYEAIGADSSARALMVAQGDDTVRRVELNTRSKRYQQLLKVTIGYGYQSTKAIRLLFGLLLIDRPRLGVRACPLHQAA